MSEAARDQGWNVLPIKHPDCDTQVATQRGELGKQIPEFGECADGHIMAARVRQHLEQIRAQRDQAS